MSYSENYERELMNSPIFAERVNQDRSVDMNFQRLSPINPMSQEELEKLDSFEFGKGTPLEGIALAKPKPQKPKKKAKKPAASSKSKKKGGKRKSRRRTRRKNGCGKKKFKKHYMWNTRGKRYVAKTYKQHKRGLKLGHTHKKPKKKSRKRRR